VTNEGRHADRLLEACVGVFGRLDESGYLSADDRDRFAQSRSLLEAQIGQDDDGRVALVEAEMGRHAHKKVVLHGGPAFSHPIVAEVAGQAYLYSRRGVSLKRTKKDLRRRWRRRITRKDLRFCDVWDEVDLALIDASGAAAHQMAVACKDENSIAGLRAMRQRIQDHQVLARIRTRNRGRLLLRDPKAWAVSDTLTTCLRMGRARGALGRRTSSGQRRTRSATGASGSRGDPGPGQPGEPSGACRHGLPPERWIAERRSSRGTR